MTSKGPYMMEKKHETNYAIYDAHRLLVATCYDPETAGTVVRALNFAWEIHVSAGHEKA